LLAIVVVLLLPLERKIEDDGEDDPIGSWEG